MLRDCRATLQALSLYHEHRPQICWQASVRLFLLHWKIALWLTPPLLQTNNYPGLAAKLHCYFLGLKLQLTQPDFFFLLLLYWDGSLSGH